ncbi:MAG: alpha-xylosidase [Gammaproteobacteria bacterium]|nr:alpha-xylosidase [Gammaproteobacteria bacterium]
MQLTEYADGFDLTLAGRVVLRHRRSEPAVFIGSGRPTVRMNHGHFHLEDYVVSRVPLTHAVITALAGAIRISLSPSATATPVLEIRVAGEGEERTVTFAGAEASINRLWLRIAAEPQERVWGGGEQLSYFDMRGRHFPLWTSEPGVGRDKSTLLTFKADQKDGGGGDYYNTNYPQPTYISSRRYALHIETTAYCAFDFRHPGFHELEIWAIPQRIELWSADHFVDLVSALATRFGRQPPLPDWVLGGAIIGLKDGARSFDRLASFAAADAAIAALWCEDWVGVRETSFGRRLFWDWKWNPQRYPHLDRKIAALKARGVRFLGYVNPYLCVDGSLYAVAAAAGYLALSPENDEPYRLDFGEFHCGIVDFTNSAAVEWFEEHVIGRNMLDFGLSGWMADFGEYLPTDVRLASGLDGMLAHNAWPTLWAKVNADAVARRGMTGETLFFMRAGFTGVQAYCPLLWAGDQSVDFSRHDGLQTVICAALSSGLLGNAYHHSDIGGYTSLFGNVRTAELIQRWTEMAAFTAVMRSHEGNRPEENLQIDQDPQVLAHFARMTRIHRHLAPYLAALSREAAATGLPVQRALFLHFEDDPRAYESQTTYLYGADLLVAPVILGGVSSWRAYLPAGAAWVHVWSHAEFAGGVDVEVAAPLGEPPVFYRKGSAFETLFAALARL